MEFQSAATGLPGPLTPSPLSPASDYGGPLSPGSGMPGPSRMASPGRGPSPSLSPVRGSSPGPGFSGQAAFNYNQLEGRFKQLQGKMEQEKPLQRGGGGQRGLRFRVSFNVCLHLHTWKGVKQKELQEVPAESHSDFSNSKHVGVSSCNKAVVKL